jgi:hypothetical protein
MMASVPNVRKNGENRLEFLRCIQGVWSIGVHGIIPQLSTTNLSYCPARSLCYIRSDMHVIPTSMLANLS